MYKIEVMTESGWKLLDLGEGEDGFALNIEGNGVDGFTDYSCGWSYDLELPRTPNNEKILGHPSARYQEGNEAAYQSHTCNVYSHGGRKIFAHGRLQLTSAGKNTYNVQVLSSAGDFFSLLEEITLEDSEENPWTEQNPSPLGGVRLPTSDIAKAAVRGDYKGNAVDFTTTTQAKYSTGAGFDTKTMVNENTGDHPVNQYADIYKCPFPMWRVNSRLMYGNGPQGGQLAGTTVFGKIEELTGYTFTGGKAWDELSGYGTDGCHHAVAFCRGGVNDGAVVESFTVKAAAPDYDKNGGFSYFPEWASGTYDIKGRIRVDEVTYNRIIFENTYRYKGMRTRFNCRVCVLNPWSQDEDTGTLQNFFKAGNTLVVSFNGGIAAGGIHGGATIRSMDDFDGQTTVGNGGSRRTYWYKDVSDEILNGAYHFEVEIYNGGTGNGFVGDSTGQERHGLIFDQDTAFTVGLVSPSDGTFCEAYHAGAWFDFGHAVGCATALDLYKALCNAFGLLPWVDSDTKEVYHYTMQDVMDNKPLAVDWSAKLDISQDYEETWDIGGSYAQHNYLRLEENAVTENVDEAHFDIRDARMDEEEADFLEVGFQSRKGGGGTDTFDMGLWHVEENEDGKKETKYEEADTPHIVRVYENCQGARWRTAAQMLGEKFYSLTGITMETNYHWGAMAELAQRQHVISAKFMLSASDIEKFNQAVPAYLSQTGRYYYVNRISEWQDGKTCTVELFELPM